VGENDDPRIVGRSPQSVRDGRREISGIAQGGGETDGHVMIPDHGPRTGIVGKTDSFRHVPDGKVAFGHGHRQDAERIYALLQEHPLQDPVGTRFTEMESRIHVAVSVLGEVSAAFGHDFLLAGAGRILPENDDSCLHGYTFAVQYIILLIFIFIRYSYA
jgi:hypothetical protein